MRISALLALNLVLLGAAPAAQPPAEIMTPIRTMLAVTEGRSAVKLDSLFLPDAVVIDEGAPYLWRGSHAASRWFDHIKNVFAALHMRDFNAATGPAIEYSHTADGAYVVIPMVLTGMAGTKPFHETGTMTYTFLRTGGEWKISSQVWTTARSMAQR